MSGRADQDDISFALYPVLRLTYCSSKLEMTLIVSRRLAFCM
jgi:hypothetical protein